MALLPVSIAPALAVPAHDPWYQACKADMVAAARSEALRLLQAIARHGLAGRPPVLALHIREERQALRDLLMQRGEPPPASPPSPPTPPDTPPGAGGDASVPPQPVVSKGATPNADAQRQQAPRHDTAPLATDMEALSGSAALRQWLRGLAYAGLSGGVYFLPGFLFHLCWWALAPESLALGSGLLWLTGMYVAAAIHALELHEESFWRLLAQMKVFVGLVLGHALLLFVGLFVGAAFFGAVFHLFGMGKVGAGVGIVATLGVALWATSRCWPMCCLCLMETFGATEPGPYVLAWRATGQPRTFFPSTLPGLTALAGLLGLIALVTEPAVPWRDAVFMGYAALLAPFLSLIMVDRAYELCMLWLTPSHSTPLAASDRPS